MNKITEGTKNIIAASILTLGIIVAAMIYASTTRYEVVTDSSALIVDKKTQTAKFVHP